jgi:hypothetical protein
MQGNSPTSGNIKNGAAPRPPGRRNAACYDPSAGLQGLATTGATGTIEIQRAARRFRIPVIQQVQA